MTEVSTIPARTLRQKFISQFKNPHGFLGSVAGWIMANRGSNVQRNLWTVKLLHIQPTDRVLELGFGPGVALQAVVADAPNGYVVGVDHSESMHRAAGRRNREAIAQGRLALHRGEVNELSSLLSGDVEPFNHVFAVNVAFFWPDPVATMKLLAKYLAPGGQLALTLQPRVKGATNKHSEEAGQKMQQQMLEAGFADIEVHYFRDVEPWPACVIGRQDDHQDA